MAAVFDGGLGAALGLWFGFKWKELALVAASVIVASLVFAHEPLVPFITGCAGLTVLCARSPGEGREWLDATWTLTKQIFPLLIAGVFVSGMLLGRPGHEALIPSAWAPRGIRGSAWPSWRFD